jgi:hypothetical protein
MTIVDSKVVISVDAETDAARRQMELLRAQQQAFAAEVMKGLDAQNQKLADSAAKWLKVGAAIGSLGVAAKFAADSWKAYVDRANAEAATYGISLESLRKASAGLKTDTELLAFAEKSLSKDLALTRKEMETVLRAQVALARNGRDAAKVEEAVGAALTKNTVKPLKELGIVLKQNEDPAKNYIQIMKALETAANDAGASQAEVGENVQRAGVMIQNSWTDVKVAAGKLVDEGLAPLAGALKWVLDVANDFLAGVGSPGGEGTQMVDEAVRRTAFGTVGGAWAARAQGRQQLSGLGLAQWQGTADATFANFAGIVSDLKVSIAKQQKFEELAAEASAKAALDAAKAAKAAEEAWFALRNAAMEGDEVAKAASWQNQFGEAPRVTGAGGGFQGMQAGSDPTNNLLSAMWGRGVSAADQSKNRLDKIFGPLEDFDAYTRAWTFMGNAATTALDAAITGSEGAAAAFKKLTAETLRALAIEMAVKAIRETAEAIGSAASYDYKGAAEHGVAAAKYAAGAAAAGLGARLLGAGGGGGGSSGGGGAAAAAPTGGAPAAGRQVTYIIATGHDFAEDSPRARLNKARQLLRTTQTQAGEGGRFE